MARLNFGQAFTNLGRGLSAFAQQQQAVKDRGETLAESRRRFDLGREDAEFNQMVSLARLEETQKRNRFSQNLQTQNFLQGLIPEPGLSALDIEEQEVGIAKTRAETGKILASGSGVKPLTQLQQLTLSQKEQSKAIQNVLDKATGGFKLDIDGKQASATPELLRSLSRSNLAQTEDAPGFGFGFGADQPAPDSSLVNFVRQLDFLESQQGLDSISNALPNTFPNLNFGRQTQQQVNIKDINNWAKQNLSSENFKKFQKTSEQQRREFFKANQ